MIRLLIVSSDTPTLRTMSEIITAMRSDARGSRIDLRKAGSGEEAIGVFTTEDFKIIIVDYELPGINGLQLIDLISHRLEIKKILITEGSPSLELRIKAAELGIEGFIQKPIRPKNVKTLINRIL